METESKMITEAEVRNFPRESQEDIYRQFYGAYLVAEQNDQTELVLHYYSLLRTLRALWGFSDEEIQALEVKAADLLTKTNKFIDLYSGPADDKVTMQ